MHATPIKPSWLARFIDWITGRKPEGIKNAHLLAIHVGNAGARSALR